MVKVGAVTTRNGARLHLAIHGRAYCGAGTGRILTALDITARHATTICLRCAAAIRRHLDEALETAAVNPRTVTRLSDTRYALRTPAEQTADAAKARIIRARITAPAPPVTPARYNWRAVWFPDGDPQPDALFAA